MKICKGIVQWNKDRGLTEFSKVAEWRMLKEELDEFQEAATDDEMVDALADIIVVATGALFKLGYDPTLVMKETLKEINSRKQDPEQKKRWESSSERPKEKWKKDVNQDPSTLYTANYKLCKLHK